MPTIFENERTIGVLIQVQTGGLFLFDATVQSEHILSAEITMNPIESSAGDITDHRRTKPTTWSFTAVLVDESDLQKISLRGFSADSGDPDPLRTARENGPAITRKAMESFEFLKRIFESSETVSVTTELQTYESVVLESLRFKVIATTPLLNDGGLEPSAIEVSGTFREVRFATSETIEVPKDPVKKKLGPKKNAGAVTPPTAPAATKTKANSALEQLFGGSVGG